MELIMPPTGEMSRTSPKRWSQCPETGRLKRCLRPRRRWNLSKIESESERGLRRNQSLRTPSSNGQHERVQDRDWEKEREIRLQRGREDKKRGALGAECKLREGGRASLESLWSEIAKEREEEVFEETETFEVRRQQYAHSIS